MKKEYFLVAILFIVGCNAGPQVKQYTGPDGKKEIQVRCTKETSACFEKASEECNGGSYKVVDSYRNSGGLFADILPGPVMWYTMSIICGPSDGIRPTFPLRGDEPAMPKGPEQTKCTKVGDTVNCTTY